MVLPVAKPKPVLKPRISSRRLPGQLRHTAVPRLRVCTPFQLSQLRAGPAGRPRLSALRGFASERGPLCARLLPLLLLLQLHTPTPQALTAVVLDMCITSSDHDPTRFFGALTKTGSCARGLLGGGHSPQPHSVHTLCCAIMHKPCRAASDGCTNWTQCPDLHQHHRAFGGVVSSSFPTPPQPPNDTRCLYTLSLHPACTRPNVHF